ncbi:helix-turn-helix transcriptional regulator [Bacillus cereus]
MNRRVIYLLRSITKTSQSELAQHIGVTQSHFSKFELGKIPIKDTYRSCLKEFFLNKGVTTEDFEKIYKLAGLK